MSDSKICEFCKKSFFKTPDMGRSWYKKRFCNLRCQQGFWKVVRNETGGHHEHVTKERRDAITFSDTQKQVILGGLLGDSSLITHGRDDGSYSLKMCHGEEQKEYLKWKVGMLRNVFLQEKANICPNGKVAFDGGDSYHYTSIYHSFFQEIYPLFYRRVQGKSKRLITMKTLNLMNIFGVLIWYLDDGNLQAGGSARIYSNAYTLSENRMMKNWLWKRFGVEAKVSFNKTANVYFLRFPVEPTKKLMRIFTPFYHQVPECMRYKLIKDA